MRFRRSIVYTVLLFCTARVLGEDGSSISPKLERLIIDGVFALLFLAEAALCCVALGAARGFRVPFAVLLPALALYFLSCLCAISNNIGTGIFDDAPPALIIAINAMVQFTSGWGDVLVFVAICIAFFDRQAVLNRHSSGRSAPVSIIQTAGCTFYALLLFALATASGALYAVFLNNLLTSPIPAFNNALELRYNSASYAFDAFRIISAAFVAFCASILSQFMKRAAVSEFASNMLVYGVFPLYAAFMFVVMTLLIIQASSESYVLTAENITVVTAILENLFLTAIFALLISMGLRRTSHPIGNLSVKSTSEVTVQAWSQPNESSETPLVHVLQDSPRDLETQKLVNDNAMAGAPPSQTGNQY